MSVMSNAKGESDATSGLRWFAQGGAASPGSTGAGSVQAAPATKPTSSLPLLSTLQLSGATICIVVYLVTCALRHKNAAPQEPAEPQAPDSGNVGAPGKPDSAHVHIVFNCVVIAFTAAAAVTSVGFIIGAYRPKVLAAVQADSPMYLFAAGVATFLMSVFALYKTMTNE